MTDNERNLLLAAADGVAELSRNRDDMIVGIAAAILDLHRLLIQSGHQTKQAALDRLTVQKDELVRVSPNQMGAAFLQSLIATLADDKLDAARWLRLPPAGTA